MESLPQKALSREVMRLVSTFLEDLGTPLALGVYLRIDNGLWEDLAQLSVDPRSYLDSASYLRDAAAVSILKKYASFPTSQDSRRANALAKWKEGERSCYFTNERLLRYLPAFSNAWDRNASVERHFAAIRKIIYNLIGSSPPSLCEGRFGPGATFSDRGRYATVPDKMASNPTLTRGSIWYLPQWLGTQWGADVSARRGELEFIPGNRYSSVPKTCLTDRSIAAEPSINGFYQLGLGRAIRNRLLVRSSQNDGWNLNVAQEVHRQVAMEASVTREFATLDLSNASDTVAYNLVKLLLPHLWFEALDGLRSPKTLVDGKWYVLEKFSSMGNGYTFELETLLFAALSIHACNIAGVDGVLGKNVFVYGDDIIVPTHVCSELISLLKFCGFEVNSAKSYFDDFPFRESCGGDFFNGVAVRPYFLKKDLNEPQNIIAFANGVSALLLKLASTGFILSRRCWLRSLDLLPLAVRRARGPAALGDIVIHDEEKRWDCRTRNGIRYLRALRPKGFRKVSFKAFRPAVVLACATYGTGNIGTPEYNRVPAVEGVIPRDGLLGYKVGWVPWS